MAVVAAPQLAAADMLQCLGLGFLLAIGYVLARCILGNSRVVCFFLDCLAFLTAAVLICSFSAAASFSGQVRWYMTAALMAGYLGWFCVLAPVVQRAQELAEWLLTRPAVLVHLMAFRPLWRGLCRLVQWISGKFRKTARKHRKKQLKKQAKVLYNSNN